jgi:hypothetical protein
MRDELWPRGVCTADRAPGAQGISKVRCHVMVAIGTRRISLAGTSIWRWLSPTHLSRKPARHRDLSPIARRQAVSHGLSQQRGALDAGRRQRIARLAHLRRLRADADGHCPPLVRSRSHERRSGAELVCSEVDDHRSLPEDVSLGAVQFTNHTTICCRHHWISSSSLNLIGPLLILRFLHPALASLA